MATSPTRAVIIVGGELDTTPVVGPGDLVVAADSGYDHAVALDMPVDILVGDLDSISAAGRDHARANSVEIEQHPIDKDATDLELAMRVAASRGVRIMDVHGGEGGRLGHLLGVVLLLTKREWDPVDIAWHTGTAIIHAATPKHPVALSVAIGEAITILPVGDVSDVTTTGLRWSLDNASLERGTTLGISNESVSDHVTVEVAEGAVLVAREGTIL